jgi:hypothetical protein
MIIGFVIDGRAVPTIVEPVLPIWLSGAHDWHLAEAGNMAGGQR